MEGDEGEGLGIQEHAHLGMSLNLGKFMAESDKLQAICTNTGLSA